MSVPRDLLREYPHLGEWSILSAWRGSIAHGTYEPSDDPGSIDDKDVMVLSVPPESFYLGLTGFGNRGTHEVQRGEWDIVVYEIRKVIRMLLGGNPNVLSVLWLPENLYLNYSQAGALLLENKDVFVGRHVHRSFCGYAKDQLHKMTHAACEGYMGEKRRRLVERHGYDTKNAAHLVRLLRMGTEFLRDGELHVVRHDSAELLDIKHGEWSLERVQDEAAHLFRLADEAYVKSDLPPRPDFGRASRLCAKIVREAWRERGEDA